MYPHIVHVYANIMLWLVYLNYHLKGIFYQQLVSLTTQSPKFYIVTVKKNIFFLLFCTIFT